MKYTNPVINGFHPDPSICRVGEDYYLVTSSFEYFPGIPVFHSRDLVNWKQTGNCLTDPSELSLENAGDSEGIWAPAIRYHEGTFYVTSTLKGFGNFIVHTEDPGGKWSAPVKVPVGGVDPSLYFEDGKAFYCTNQSLHDGTEEITLEVIDIHTGELLGEQRTIWNGIGGGFLEAPHIYRIEGWYYLIAAEGGTQFNHMITAARSRCLYGPYESCPFNPILTNVHDTSKQVQCAGHGDLFQDHLGNWWFVHLAVRPARRTMSHLGRETFLTPVIWKDGWPYVENRRMAAINCDGPLWAAQNRRTDGGTEAAWKADFSRAAWEPEWIFLRKPETEQYIRGDGRLLLYPTDITLKDTEKSPTFAAVRQPDFECTLEAEFQFVSFQDGDEAGIGIRLSSEFYCFFGKKRYDGQDFLVLEKKAEDFEQTAFRIPLSEEKLRLCVAADREKYHFLYAGAKGRMEEAGSASTRFLSCETAGKCFTGTVMGLYTASKEKTEAVMEVTGFCLR